MKIKRAVISVSDKAGLAEFARSLHELGVEILSTGGTAKLIRDAGIPISSVSDYTGFPEILDGRVKTLHPKIYGGILARRDSVKHIEQLKEHGIEPIDLVVVNLYPFEETILKEGVTDEEAIENIDIGGPTMIRAAAKNYESVAVVVNPTQYDKVIEEMRNSGGELNREMRRSLAKEAFAHTAKYDRAIAGYFKFVGISNKASEASAYFRGLKPETSNQKPEAGSEKYEFPQSLNLRLEKVQDLRYGENPHQRAAFYRGQGVAEAKQLHGKELSFNNYLDLDAAWKIAWDFEESVAVIIKHTNPCGVAVDKVLAEAYRKARSCDPISAFGSIVGFNRDVDPETAEEIAKTFIECVIAPGFSEEALEILRKKKDIRLLQGSGFRVQDSDKGLDYKRVSGGLLVQERDAELFGDELKVVTERKPTTQELKALKFAWRVTKHVKSNAVVLCNQTQTLGIGAGQMSRIDSVKLAIMKMSNQLPVTSNQILVLASDAFFPFRDSIDEAKKVGVTAVIQPGGSARDEEVIAACNDHDIAMVFTGMRHFRH